MDIKFDAAKWQMDSDGNMWLMLCVSPTKENMDDAKKFVGTMRDKLHVATLKEYRKKRSVNANDLCWTLCSMIAAAIGSTKEEVYRESIRQVGEFEPFPVRTDALERFAESWALNGIGWFVEVVDDAKFEGYKRVHAYYGSSTYDTKEMWRLINNLMQDAEAQGLQLPPNDHIRTLMEEHEKAWEEKQSKAKHATSP